MPIDDIAGRFLEAIHRQVQGARTTLIAQRETQIGSVDRGRLSAGVRSRPAPRSCGSSAPERFSWAQPQAIRNDEAHERFAVTWHPCRNRPARPLGDEGLLQGAGLGDDEAQEYLP